MSVILPLIYGMLFGMPGIPCVYYGSEWGTKANKSEGDPALRVSFEKPEWNDLTELISKMAEAHKNSKALCYGSIKIPVLTNKQCIIEREFEGERVLVAINADDQPFHSSLLTQAAVRQRSFSQALSMILVVAASLSHTL